MKTIWILGAAAVAATAGLWAHVAEAASPTDRLSYNLDVRPVLSDNCFYCHGPDQNQRKGKLRLDVREEAIRKGAIVPGKPDESGLVQRIFTTDEDDLMPPAESHKKLTASQKEMLRRWVAEGAEYQNHWAFVAPQKQAVPAGENAIDHFVRQRLAAEGLKPAPEADRRTLVRRLHFDLTGLPARPTDVEAFENDRSATAYENLADRLLNSPHYGERMALGWLDVVRYADTIGYHSDNPRNIWPYRDYVIRAFNQNKPFDQFTREQVAGDLLPGSTREQKVASAFNRLLLSTEEGGAQPKDYEARMLTDRVRAVGSVWLGQTLGCTQCHDHKFDPSTMRDFYSLGAFFADIQEPIIGRREDGMLVAEEPQEAELARRTAEADRLQREYDGPHPALEGAFARWMKDQREAALQAAEWTRLRPARMESKGGARLTAQGDDSVLAGGPKPEKDTYTLHLTNILAGVVALRVEALPDGSLPSQGPGRSGNGNFVLTEIQARVERPETPARPVAFKAARATFEQTTIVEKNPHGAWTAASAIDADAKGEEFGWAILPETGKPHQLVLQLASPLDVGAGESLVVELRQNHGHGAHTLGRFRLSATSAAAVAQGPLRLPPPKEIGDILVLDESRRDEAQKNRLFAFFKGETPELATLRRELAEARKARADYEAGIPRCLVSVSSNSPRTVRILPRGNWMVETGEIMRPAFPGYLPAPVPSAGERVLSRLDLADWLVSRDNPLTARVVMNRMWKQFFGMGLARVADDFGMQGEPPSHPALLDWLACEFMDSGWDVRHMVRTIVLSRTYRQASSASKDLLARDPQNRLLARQGRWRIEAEFVRDSALSVAGLLVPKVGGPSVKPYQPDGYWENLNFPPRTYEADKGEAQYRRGLYTWWQRSFLHPSLLAFDAPSREECAAERNRSNIPQQALVLLNDPSYVEAARVFAVRILREGGGDAEARARWAWRQGVARNPAPEETRTLLELYEKHLGEYRQDGAAAGAILKVGFQPAPSDLDPAELAAWTSVARVLLNLHETITRS